MKRNPAFGILLLSLSALAFLTGCAAQRRLRDPSVPKCYIAAEDNHLSQEDHARIFQAVESEGRAFPPCDSAPAEALRISPQSSRLASKTTSYVVLGFDAAVLGAGFGLGLAYDWTTWLMPILLQATPTSNITYRADYTDAKGKKSHHEFIVLSDAWFKDPDESKPLLLEKAPRDLSTILFQKKYPRIEDTHFGRVSIDLEPLMLARSFGGIQIEPRFEKFLPWNFSLGVTPRAFIPFSTPDHRYSIHAGARRYFDEGHSGLYLGLEPYAERSYYYGRLYSRVALPVTFGAVFQRQRLMTSIDLGYGPSKVLNGAYTENYVTLSSLTIGYRF